MPRSGLLLSCSHFLRSTFEPIRNLVRRNKLLWKLRIDGAREDNKTFVDFHAGEVLGFGLSFERLCRARAPSSAGQQSPFLQLKRNVPRMRHRFRQRIARHKTDEPKLVELMMARLKATCVNLGCNSRFGQRKQSARATSYCAMSGCGWTNVNTITGPVRPRAPCPR
jgi:hypothetical protein